MWNLLIIIRLLSVFRCFALPNLSSNSASEIGQNRILYGSYAEIKNFPYVVPLSELDNQTYVFRCSASLLTTTFVLTAGHCLVNRTTLYVGLGDQTEYTHRSYAQSKSYRIHENYKSGGYKMNDIGLVELLKSIDNESFVASVKLPSKSDASLSYMAYKAFASGWGRTKHDKFSVRLKFLNVTIVSNDQCPFHIKSTEIICGMGANFGRVCHGDSGGPLVIQNSKNEILQIGVVSFGNPKCMRGYGSFYVRVTRFLDWIQKHSDYKFM